MIKMLKKFLNLEMYISPLDRFLIDFDKGKARTNSQQREEKKHLRIKTLRDKAHVTTDTPTKLWDKF